MSQPPDAAPFARCQYILFCREITLSIGPVEKHYKGITDVWKTLAGSADKIVLAGQIHLGALEKVGAWRVECLLIGPSGQEKCIYDEVAHFDPMNELGLRFGPFSCNIQAAYIQEYGPHRCVVRMDGKVIGEELLPILPLYE